MRPGGELATRPLHFIWIADCSISMRNNGKIEALNQAIRETLPLMKQVADENPNAEVLIRAIKFSSGASWHVEKPTPAEHFFWQDLSAGGVTDMGMAFQLLEEALKIPPMSERALPPILVLLSDGQPTDDYQHALQSLLKVPWAIKAVRIAIAIGKSANKTILKQFINQPEMEPLQAENAAQLLGYIKWASTAVLKSTSAPSSYVDNVKSFPVNVVLPALPEIISNAISVEDVW